MSIHTTECFITVLFVSVSHAIAKRTICCKETVQEKYFTDDTVVLEDELWMRHDISPQTAEVGLCQPDCGNLGVFNFWILRSVWWGLDFRQESCAIAKMTAQCALHMGALKIFGTLWLRPRQYSQHFYGLLFRSTLWMFLQNLNFVALPIPEIIGGTQKNLGSPWICPRSLFSKILNGFLLGLAVWMYPNLKSITLPVPKIRG